jgi:hypothetical protein
MSTAHNSASPATSPLASSTTEKQARSSRGSPTAYGDAAPAGIGRHGRESALRASRDVLIEVGMQDRDAGLIPGSQPDLASA